MMYQIVFKMYFGFQCSLQGREQPAIFSRGSPKEYMNHKNGDRNLVPLKMDIPRIPKFVLGWARTSNYLLSVPNEYLHHDRYDSSFGSPKHEFKGCTYFLLN